MTPREERWFLPGLAIVSLAAGLAAWQLHRGASRIETIPIPEEPISAAQLVVDDSAAHWIELQAWSPESVADAAPEDPIVASARALRSSGDLAEARRTLTEALTIDPKRPTLLAELGALDLAERRDEDALTHLRQVLEARPDDTRSRYNLALALARSGRADAAQREYLGVLARHPDDSKSLINLGLLEMRAGALEEARSRWLQVTERAVPTKAAKAHFLLGKWHRRQEQPETALVHYRRAVDLRPDYAIARNNLALTLDAVGDREGAIAELERTCRLAPELQSARYNLGRLYLESGRADEAIEHLEAAVDRPRAKLLLAPLLADRGRNAAAATLYREVLEERPDDVRALRGLADVARAGGQHAIAAGALEELTRLRPASAAAWRQLGVARARLDDDRGALAAYDRALKLDPDARSPRFNAGLAHERLGEIDAALERFRGVVASEPDHVGAWRHIARLELRRGRPEPAVEAAGKLARLAPDDPDTLWVAARVLADGGRKQEASALLDRLERLTPDSPRVARERRRLEAS